ncbi:MAG: hypothetical protein OEW08_11835, partial [Gammaproteobacteria bacterium]|nr:hypothetical protein [Gammaproteobacteria bacterium]
MAIKYGLNEWHQYVPRDEVNAPIVLCFGDSWFWYPFPGSRNLSQRFLEFGRYQSMDIAVLGENGMEITDPGKRILADVTTFLQYESKTLDMIVVSGGGNDFAGADDLDPILTKGKNSDITSWFKVKETN